MKNKMRKTILPVSLVFISLILMQLFVVSAAKSSNCYIRANVHNLDDDTLNIKLYIDDEYKETKTFASNEEKNFNDYAVKCYNKHTVKITWTDPDTNKEYNDKRNHYDVQPGITLSSLHTSSHYGNPLDNESQCWLPAGCSKIFKNPQKNGYLLNSIIKTGERFCMENGMEFERFETEDHPGGRWWQYDGTTSGYNNDKWEVHTCSYNNWKWDNCYNKVIAIVCRIGKPMEYLYEKDPKKNGYLLNHNDKTGAQYCIEKNMNFVMFDIEEHPGYWGNYEGKTSGYNKDKWEVNFCGAYLWTWDNCYNKVTGILCKKNIGFYTPIWKADSKLNDLNRVIGTYGHFSLCPGSTSEECYDEGMKEQFTYLAYYCNLASIIPKEDKESKEKYNDACQKVAQHLDVDCDIYRNPGVEGSMWSQCHNKINSIRWRSNSVIATIVTFWAIETAWDQPANSLGGALTTLFSSLTKTINDIL